MTRVDSMRWPVRSAVLVVAAVLRHASSGVRAAAGRRSSRGRRSASSAPPPSSPTWCSASAATACRSRRSWGRASIRTSTSPTPGDRKKLDDAHLVFFNGLHLEGKMADLFEKNHERWRAYAVTDGIDRGQLLHADVDGGEHDPHVWFDVKLWAEHRRRGAEGPHRTRPGRRGRSTSGTRPSTVKELDALDAEVRKELDDRAEGAARAGHVARRLRLLRPRLRLRGDRAPGRQHRERDSARPSATSWPT